MLNIIKEAFLPNLGISALHFWTFISFPEYKNRILKAILHIYVFVNSEKQKKRERETKTIPTQQYHNNNNNGNKMTIQLDYDR